MRIDFKRLSLFLILLVLTLILFNNKEHINKENLQAFIQGLGWLAPLGFMLIYIVAVVLFFPGTIFTVVAGFVFGPVLGTIYSLIACTIGSTLAFLIARYLARDWVEAYSHSVLDEIRARVNEHGWRSVAIARLLPISPFSILNSAFGLTKISAVTYMITSFIFLIPLTVIYVYLGYVGQGFLPG